MNTGISNSTPIVAATLDEPIRYNDPPDHYVYGDIWDTAWADDDTLYTLIDDTYGWNDELRATGGRNLIVGSFGGSRPPQLRGAPLNSMDAFGHSTQLGADGASWKANGLICVDGVMYLTVSRHRYGQHGSDNVQVARDASIVVSRDYGYTWSPAPPHGEPFPVPLFPGPNFATPFFVKYGRDGAAPARPVDEADRYVYAVSTDGYWDNGNAIHLGRVARADLPLLDADQWEFCTGVSGSTPSWRRGLDGLASVAPILNTPGRCGQAGIQYIPILNRYIMLQWFYPDLSAADFNVKHSVWEWYEAPHPWGPWTLFQRWDWPTQGFYNPSIPAKFIDPDGHGLWVLTTGDFLSFDQPPDQTKYTLHMMRVTLHTAH